MRGKVQEQTETAEPQDISLKLLEGLLASREKLEADIARLTAQRETLGRFLAIDEELAELDRLARRKEVLIAEATTEAAAIRETAQHEADRLRTEAAQQATRLLDETAATAQRDAQTVMREANQAATAQRQSTEKVYLEARQKTARVDEELAERLKVFTAKEEAMKIGLRNVADREATIARVESAVDGKRSMLRAGIDALRRVLDEVQA